MIEAAACGTPSIASNSPGLRDSVRHGETGFLVRHGDVEGLAQRMLELAGQPALVAALGTAARRFAEGLTWERTASDDGATSPATSSPARAAPEPGGGLPCRRRSPPATARSTTRSASAPAPWSSASARSRIAPSSPPSCSTPTAAPADGGAAPPRRRAASCWWRSGEADDHRTALDRAEEKLRRQLDKDPAHPKARRSRDSLPKIG